MEQTPKSEMSVEERDLSMGSAVVQGPLFNLELKESRQPGGLLEEAN